MDVYQSQIVESAGKLHTDRAANALGNLSYHVKQTP